MNFLSVLAGFFPWIVFSVLVERDQPRAVAYAAVVALVLSVAGLLWSRIRGRSAKMLEVIGAVAFAVFAVAGIFVSEATDRWLSDWLQGGSNLILAVAILVMIPVLPFTEQYAREMVPREQWSSPLFRAINRRISGVWCVAIALAGISQLAATWLDDHDTPHGTLDLVLTWLVPIAVYFGAVRYTRAAADVDEPADDEYSGGTPA